MNKQDFDQKINSFVHVMRTHGQLVGFDKIDDSGYSMAFLTNSGIERFAIMYNNGEPFWTNHFNFDKNTVDRGVIKPLEDE